MNDEIQFSYLHITMFRSIRRIKNEEFKTEIEGEIREKNKEKASKKYP